MLGWFRGLLRGPGRADPPRPGPAAATQPPPAGIEEPPFAPFARALALEIPPPVEDAPLDAATEEAAARVLAHALKNRPGPASAPTLSLQVLGLVASPGGDVSEMVRLISADPALSAGLLQVANSAYYRGLEEIETVRAAVVRLGLDEVARVAGGLAARSLFNPKLKAELAAYAPRFHALYLRALAVASGAAFVAMGRGGRPDRAFLGGMLHDVGRSVALRSVAAISTGADRVPDGVDVDRVIDRVHVDVGAECHQEWSLPNYLTVIAVRHHDAMIPGGPEFIDLHAVRLASALVHLRDPAHASRAAAEIVQSAGALGMDAYAVRSADAELRDAAARTLSAFGSPRAA